MSDYEKCELGKLNWHIMTWKRKLTWFVLIVYKVPLAKMSPHFFWWENTMLIEVLGLQKVIFKLVEPGRFTGYPKHLRVVVLETWWRWKEIITLSKLINLKVVFLQHLIHETVLQAVQQLVWIMNIYTL